MTTGKQKQDVIIADHSSTAKLILWEEQIGSLQEYASYRLENLVVREWGGAKYLSMAKDTKKFQIDDIADVKTVEDDHKTIQDVHVVLQCPSLTATKHAYAAKLELSLQLMM